MRILIEEHQYLVADIKDVLHGIDTLEDIEGKVSISYVGYFYNTQLQDCVFILPKVFLEDVNGNELAFGKYRPEDIINLNTNNPLTQQEKGFIYEFSVWIYRAIVVYNDNNKEANIVYHQKIIHVGKGHRRLNNTFLDILLSLVQFNKENQIFFSFILKNLHSGYNKINWARTIGTTNAIVQGNSPVYLNLVNKKKQINFEEELLIIFFSILNYIGDYYGFPKNINCNFQLIKGKKFQTFLNGLGKTRLLQIKYKYFSDKALQLWELCYAFFDNARQVFISTEQKEYLLVKSFYIVFESIIDELVGDNPLPDGMEKRQDDGKIVDHLFTGRGLIENDNKSTYYIGDSKYYKMGAPLGKESIYKQYTYARNVIQWNLDIFNSGKSTNSGVKLRDDETEGYNIIPNFFISAKMNKDFSYTDVDIEKTGRTKNRYKNTQFNNRLFDRDTLLLFHYDVNFLFVLSLYAKNNASMKVAWKTKVRDKFRAEIQSWLQEDYDFYAMKARSSVNATQYFKTHFQEVIGKIYTPYQDARIYSLALDNTDTKNNDALLSELRTFFFVEKCGLGCNPTDALSHTVSNGNAIISSSTHRNGVLMVMMEGFDNKTKNFVADGRLAVGIKYTKDSMAIVEHLSDIGYVLFHVRKDEGQHFYAIIGNPCVKSENDLESLIYRNVNTTKMYVELQFDVNELDSTTIHSSKRGYASNSERYDAQYTSLDELCKE